MKLKKIIFLILIILLVNFIFVSKTFAIADILTAGDEFLEAGGEESEVINETTLKSTSSTIYNILLACGTGVAVIVGAVLGITFIVSSAEGKAKVSETLVPYIVGCFVVFGAFGIWKVVINIENNLFTDVIYQGRDFKSDDEIWDAYYAILNDERDISSYTNGQIKSLYEYFGINVILYDRTKIQSMSLEDAVNKLDDPYIKIYDEAKTRGLLKENGIGLID